MGDYGFCVPGSDQALSPVDLSQLSGNRSLFSPENMSKMHDENMAEKSRNKANVNVSFTEPGKEPASPKVDTAKRSDVNDKQQQSESVKPEESKTSTNLSDEAVNSVITSLSQLGLTTEASTSSTSGSQPNVSSVQGMWSTAGGEEALMSSIQHANGSLNFQQPPPPVVSSVNATFGNNLLPAQVPQTSLSGLQVQAQRRAITGQQSQGNITAGGPPPQVQNVFVNNSKNYPSWSNGSHGHQLDWLQRGQAGQPGQGNLWSGMHHDHNQSRSMNSLNNLAVAGQFKKANAMNPSLMISPSKYRRSTSYPAQYPVAIPNKMGLDLSGMDGRAAAEQGLLALQQVRK